MLTPADYIEIQQLVAKYAYALDTCADDGYMYADLFTDDGVAFETSGRDNLAKLALAEPHGQNYARHFAMSVIIEPSGKDAVGKQYLVMIDFDPGGNGNSIVLGGRYEDVYRKTANGWRFKSRTLVRSQRPD